MDLASFVSLVIMGPGRRNFAGNSLLASTFGELTFFVTKSFFTSSKLVGVMAKNWGLAERELPRFWPIFNYSRVSALYTPCT